MDSFKGSLTALQACEAVRQGLLGAGAAWEVRSVPMADGGEGTAQAFQQALSGERCEARVRGPLGDRTVKAGYTWIPDRREAVVELAEASGLTLLGADERDPLCATTFGTGQLIGEASRKGAQRILLGVGGSATVDGGAGAARALGWRFLDGEGRDLEEGGGALRRLRRLERPEALDLPPVEVLCDVNNPLLGELGAAAVFGPQKGAGPREVPQLEAGLRRLAGCVKEQLGIDIGDLPGGGAAGGMAAGAVAFLGARLVSGIDAVMDSLDLAAALEAASWAITGEGSFDAQSLHGKVVSGVTRLARASGVRVAVLAGRVTLEEDMWRDAGIDYAAAAAPDGMATEEAVGRAAELLTRAAGRLAASRIVQGAGSGGA